MNTQQDDEFMKIEGVTAFRSSSNDMFGEKAPLKTPVLTFNIKNKSNSQAID
jgi:hypothetical protein